MVSPRTVHRAASALKLAQAVLLAAIAVTTWSILNPRSHNSLPDEIELQAPDSVSLDAQHDLPPLDRFAALWGRNLRQELFDPVATPSPTPPAAPKRPLPRLLSTVVSGDRHLAQLAPDKGPPRIVGPGDDVDGYTVSAIDAGRILLVQGDAQHWIEIQRAQPLIAERP